VEGAAVMERKPRVLIAKVGLDGHDRGAKVVARALRDADMEVIYTGRRQIPEQIVNAAIQEGVDAIGISVLSGAHDMIFKRVLDLLNEKEAGEICLIGGGIIPRDDAEVLKESGVTEIFGPGSDTRDIVNTIRAIIRERKGSGND